MDGLLALAAEVGADLALANDPDADRIAAAVPDRSGTWRPLTGNQIGVLLADHLLGGLEVERPLVVSSIVSTPMLADVAAAHGARAEVSLTGFKWICAAARGLEEDGYTFVYGFEEALGSCVGDVVHDKDGISAAVVLADMARVCKAEDRSLLDRWDELCERHGRWVSRQLSVVRPGASGAAEIAAAMERLSGWVPQELAGQQVTSTTDFRTGADLRPTWLAAQDLVLMELTDGRVMIRPSGTEPKCKIYVDLRGRTAAEEDPDTLDAQLGDRAETVARALAEAVGLS